MGKKSSWFCSLALSSSKRSKSKKGFGTSKSLDSIVTSYEDVAPLPVPTTPPALAATPPPPPPPPQRSSSSENEQRKHAYSVALATAAAAEAAVAAAQAAAEVVRLTTAVPTCRKSKEEIASIRIQTAFRGYMARRALRALKGLVRLKTLLQGQSVKRQANSTLRAMQALARVQSQIRVRRSRMAEENQALQRQIQQKHDKELERLKSFIGAAKWDDSMQSKEQIEASLLHKQEAVVRRERALAYAYTHQQTWKNSWKNGTATFMDPNNPQWGWSWLERWMAARPWDSRTGTGMDDQGSLNFALSRTVSLGEISRPFSRYNNKSSPSGQRSSSCRPLSRHSPSTPASSKAPSFASVTGKMRGPSYPRGSGGGSTWGGDGDDDDDYDYDYDSRSMFSVRSERYRRHSITGSSSVRDDESLGSSPSVVPSYMGATQSAKAKSRFSTPMGLDNNDKASVVVVASVKKRLTFSPSSASLRRHSGPPKIDVTLLKMSEADEGDNVRNIEGRSM
ncbi:Protein IQ-DOMAIN 2 [Linum perenne]